MAEDGLMTLGKLRSAIGECIDQSLVEVGTRCGRDGGELPQTPPRQLWTPLHYYRRTRISIRRLCNFRVQDGMPGAPPLPLELVLEIMLYVYMEARGKPHRVFQKFSLVCKVRITHNYILYAPDNI